MNMRLELLEGYRDYAGRVYGEFFVQRAPERGPGWFIYGRAQRVSASVVTLVARPNVPLRRTRHYNGLAMMGWRTKRDALAAIAELPARDAK
jgi:hypothetical protein